MKKRLFAVLALILLSVLVFAPLAEALNPVTGESNRTTEELYDGVVHTTVTTPKGSQPYGSTILHIVEVDMSKTDLYFDVRGGGQYLNDRATQSNILSAFNKEGAGKTAITSVNGDMWVMNGNHVRQEGTGASYGGYSDAVVKNGGGVLTIPRGFTMYDGEIVCTPHMAQETPYEGDFWSFGITDDFVPVLGNPTADIAIKNKTQNTSTTADGLNRLPANGALVVYSDKGALNNYALDDAYEVVIDLTYDYTIKHGATLTGRVTAIYGPSDSGNPTMKENRIILTARGNRVSRIEDYNIGDVVELSFSVRDRSGRNDEAWRKVTNAVGGHMQFAVDGKYTPLSDTNATDYEYPTTLVGYDREGKLVFIQADGRSKRHEGGPDGLDMSTYTRLAKDLGIYEMFLMDGGGSSYMMVPDDGSYKVANQFLDDGSQRAVVNAIIISHGPERGKQGEIKIDDGLLDIDVTNVRFNSEAKAQMFGNSNQANVSYDFDEGAVKLEANVAESDSGGGMADPWVQITYEQFGELSADEYKYLVFTYMMPADIPSVAAGTALNMEIFLAAGTTTGAEGGKSVTNIGLTADGKYHSVVVDLTSKAYWAGAVTHLVRFDFIQNFARNGDVMYVKNIQWATSADGAQALAAEAENIANHPELDNWQTAPGTTPPATTAPEESTPPEETTPPQETDPVTTEPATSETEPATTDPATTEDMAPATGEGTGPATPTTPPATTGNPKTGSYVLITCAVLAVVALGGFVLVKKIRA